MVAVEVDNRSGVEVEEAGGGRAGAARARRRGRRRRRARARISSAPDEIRDAQARAPRRRRGRRTCSRSRSTGATSSPAACRASSATPFSVPQVVGEAWRPPLVHGLLHLLGYDHGAEMEARGGAMERMTKRRAADAPRELQLRLRRDHPRAPDATEHADPLPRAVVVLVAARRDRRLEARADRAPARDRVRVHRRDDQLRARAGDRRRDDLVRPAREAREGHRRRSRADRDRQRRRDRLPRLLR